MSYLASIFHFTRTYLFVSSAISDQLVDSAPSDPFGLGSMGYASSIILFTRISLIVSSMIVAGLKLGGIDRGGNSLNVPANCTMASFLLTLPKFVGRQGFRAHGKSTEFSLENGTTPVLRCAEFVCHRLVHNPPIRFRIASVGPAMRGHARP